MKKIILASSSQYRKKLLNTICRDFVSIKPNIDESRQQQELIPQLVSRLACEKAKAVASKINYDALIIGSDQAAEFNNQLIGKPKNHEAAVEHLLAVSGKKMTLHTGLTLLNTATGSIQTKVVPFTVKYKKYTESTVQKYLAIDKPYDCAGALKAESYGILLIEKMTGDDPNALIGLPLIALAKMLENENYSLL